MMASLQASGGRHLAPAASPYIWRALVWEENIAGWRLSAVFDMATLKDAEMFALDVTTEPWDDGVTAMHYIVGEVAS